MLFRSQGQADASYRTVLLAEPKANAIIIRAANPARVALARSLVERLDQPGAHADPAGNIHVVYLKNADATKLAVTLRAAIAAGDSRGAGAGASGTSSAAPAPGAAAGMGAAGGAVAGTAAAGFDAAGAALDAGADTLHQAAESAHGTADRLESVQHTLQPPQRPGRLMPA